MHIGRLALAPVLCLALCGAGPQEPEADWDLTQDPATGIVLASISFSNGVGIGLRCVNGRYDALIAGLPDAEAGAEDRPVSLQFGDGTPDEQSWFVGNTPSVAISDMPTRLARALRAGGTLKVRVREAGAEGRRVRYDLDMPASPAQIDRTLTACGKPTVDARDALLDLTPSGELPGDIIWLRPPEPRYPDGRTFVRGFVVTSCVSRPDGRLDDCVIESEYPTGGGFAEEALRATRRSRVGFAGARDTPVPSRLIIYRTNFSMESFQDTAVREAQPSTRFDRPSSRPPQQ